MTSSFEEEGEQEEVEVDEDGDEEYFDKSVSSIPVEYENEESEYYYQDGFHSDRSVYEEQDNFQMSDQSFFFPYSPSPSQESGKIKTSRPPISQAVMPEDVKKKGLPPIPGHVFSKVRVAPKSKVKIFQEKLPNYNKVVGSTGYGKNTKQRAPPSCVRKQTVVLPPLQNTRYRSQQLTSSNEVSCHEDFMQYSESLAVKRSTIRGIVKPNLIRKDLMKLRDPTVRPRAPKQTVVMQQEVVVRGLIRHQHELIPPKIPQPPPPRVNNNNNARVFPGSRIPKLPTIEQINRGMSGIPKPCPPPQSMAQFRPGASHRRFRARETGLLFPRRQ